MTIRFAALAAAALLALAACDKPAATPADVGDVIPPASDCPDDGPRLALTNLCRSRAINYIDPAIGLISDAPADCAWEMTETAFPTDDEVLLYRALTCNGVTTQLEFAGGARSAALTYVTSALAGDAVKGEEPVRIFPTDPADPQKALRDLFEGIPETDRADCEIRPAGIDVWPSDALVIALNDAARAARPQDEPLWMCGEFGQDEDTASYWRIAQGYAWFFMLGQDTPDIDPGSFLLMRKAADGTWAPAT